MEYEVYPENKTLCLTPESKIYEWIKLIHKMASEGNVVKLYADTETTGFIYANRGRPTYDPVLERKSLMRDSMAFNYDLKELEKEARSLAGKVDRIIEVAFVACYTNKNGETYPLLDQDGEQVYFHEMIHPNTDNLLPENKNITKMPLVPYAIHKTSFEFLEGKEAHPFLNITLPRKAPSTTEVFTHFRDFFEYEDDTLYDNIIMLFHNGNEFDVPFLNSEMNRVPEMNGLTIRDMVQVYDSLGLIKHLLPNPIQKLIAFAQWDENYGGNPELKKEKDQAIQNTSKSLDNLIKLARFLPSFDLKTVLEYQDKRQADFASRFKTAALNSNIKIWESLLNYFDAPSLEMDLISNIDKEFVKTNKHIIDEYKKFKKFLTVHKKLMDEVNVHDQILHNLMNLQENIKKNKDLQLNIKCITEMGRESHGAKVDSMLFMYAFTIIENALYNNQKIINEHKFVSNIKLSDDLLEDIKKKKTANLETTKEAVQKFSDKYKDVPETTDKQPVNSIKPKF